MRVSETKANRWKRQLDSLKRHVPAVQCVSAMGDQWIVKVVRSDYTEFCSLRIILPPTFPQSCPSIQVEGSRLSHSWIDVGMNVYGHPLLRGGWTPTSDLGILVSDVLREFYLNPPKPYQESFPPAQVPVDKPPQLPAEPAIIETQIEEFCSIEIPQGNEELRSLPQKELHCLQTDNDTLRSYVFRLPSVKQSLTDLETSVQNNKRDLENLAEMEKTIKDLDMQIESELAERNQKITQILALKQEENTLKARYDWKKFKEIFVNEAQEELEKLNQLKTDLAAKTIGWPAYEKKYLEIRTRFHRAASQAELIEYISMKA